ncbi:hypothetical protein AO398_06050 [Methylobacterium sp. GXS13]|jgi:hypothetical protein|uniref:hypothetical protein n=1 Tax=Methylobacterium sp. GXS13 TaxID=1730094 RepID=UPI00071B0060|nr:hypothetical protein [Methylobacterium sp. GXS13]KST58371.1 hypothetical protein AO398_06050 [Methylobacterium sp. GXS13]
MRLISPFIVAVAYWRMRRVRRAGDDMRRAREDLCQADDLATRALRTLVAVGQGPIPRTLGSVPAISPMPVLIGVEVPLIRRTSG